jgi:hypothetical protein
MIRKLLQAVLCLVLSPLLIALPVAAEGQPQAAEPAAPAAVNTLPLPASLDFVKGRKIVLVAREPVSIEMAQIGAPFQFVVDKDVVADGVTLIHAGTPVTGVIAKVNRGSYERSRDGYLDLRLSEPAGERPVTVRLGGIPPQPVYRVAADNPWDGFGEQLERAFLVTGIVIGTIFLLIIVAALI